MKIRIATIFNSNRHHQGVQCAGAIWGKAIWMLTCLILVSVNSSYGESSRLLKPQDVVIQSSYEEKIEIPAISHQLFDLRFPQNIKEPYLPELALPEPHFPLAFPNNTPIGWLPRFSPNLAGIFWGNEGLFRNGILFFQEKKYQQAEKAFQPLISENTGLKEKATLWLAWTKFKEGENIESFRLLNSLGNGTDTETSIEIIYLKALIHVLNSAYEKVVSLFSQEGPGYALRFSDARLAYAYVYSLAQLKEWKQIETLFLGEDFSKIRHAPLYAQIAEIGAVAAYHTHDYINSIQFNRYLLTLHQPPVINEKTHRVLAWLYYLTGDYPKAISQIHSIHQPFFNSSKEELEYLLISCLVRQKKWADVERRIQNFPSHSAFFKFLSYQIRTLIEDPDKHSSLLRRLPIQNIEYPELKFHLSLLEGNYFFNHQQYENARNQFLRALSVDTTSNEYWMAQYNLGLTYLELGQFEDAQNNFITVQSTQTTTAIQAKINYHLLYTYYRLRRADDCVSILQKTEKSLLSRSQTIEVEMIQGACLLLQKKNPDAIRVFLAIHRQFKNQKAFDTAIKTLYREGNYHRILQLLNKYPSSKSQTVLLYQVKSMLALGKVKAAETAIQSAPAGNQDFVDLQLEVWAAGGNYQKIIDYISTHLPNESNKKRRLFLYFSLGDAYFNTKAYDKSKNQFYKALQLTDNPEMKNLILYDIILMSYYDGDEVSFRNEIQATLKKSDLDREIRFNLTLLLADYYQNKKEFQPIDKLLADYIAKHPYKREQIQLKRARIAFQTNHYAHCFSLSQKPFEEESLFQRRDRLVLVGYCAKKSDETSYAIQHIAAELEAGKNSYRQSELTYLLAKAYFANNRFRESLKISKQLKKQPLQDQIKKETQILVANNLLQLNRLATSLKELGDPTAYYQYPDQYVDALTIEAEVKLKQKKTDEGARSYLRIYYLPQTPPLQKQQILVRLAENYWQNKNLNYLKKVLDMIDVADLQTNHSQLFKRYQAIKDAAAL